MYCKKIDLKFTDIANLFSKYTLEGLFGIFTVKAL